LCSLPSLSVSYQDIIEKYDADMGEKHDELLELQATREREAERLQELTRR
jgi:hypothetical protein